MKNRLPHPQAVLWDMDGTMIDQTEAIIRCYADVVTHMGYERPDPHIIRRSLGGPMPSTMALFIDSTRLEEACQAFRAHFPKMMYEGLIILPGTIELLKLFADADIPQAIFTNKHGDTARAVSKHTGFSKYTTACIGNSDTNWHKPQAELTQHVLQKIGADKTGAIMIGDSPTDVETASNAGIPCYCVATGAHSKSELAEAGATAAFDSLLDFKRCLSL